MGSPSNDPSLLAAELACVIQREEELHELQQEVDQAMLDLEDWHARRDEQRREYCAQLEEEYGFSIDTDGQGVLGQTLLEGLHEAGLLNCLADCDDELALADADIRSMHLEASSHDILVANVLDVQRSHEDAQARELAMAADLAADEMRIAQLHEEIAWLHAQEAQLQAEVESPMPGLYETMTTDGGFEQWELLSHAEMLDLERRIAEVRASCDRLSQQELSAKIAETSRIVAEKAEWLSTQGSAALGNAIANQESRLDRTADLDQTAPLSPPDPAPFSVTQQLSTLDDKATASAAAGKGTPPAAAPLSARTEAPPLSARTTLPKDAGKDAGRAEKAKADSSAARELTQTQELDALLDEVRNV